MNDMKDSVPDERTAAQSALGALIKQLNPILAFLEQSTRSRQPVDKEFAQRAQEMEERNAETVQRERMNKARQMGNPIMRYVPPPSGSESSRIRMVPEIKPQITL